MTITDRDMRQQVLEALSGASGFDVDGIVEEIRRTYGLIDIGDIDGADFADLVASRSVLGQRGRPCLNSASDSPR